MVALTIKGTKAHIKNKPIALNETLDFQAIDGSQGLKLVKLSDIQSNYKIISSVPSLDTKTCEIETIRFNNEISKEFTDFTFITISKDLPFAQTRFCHALNINKNFHIWSDYRNNINNFAKATNLLIEETQLLARCIMVVDHNNKVLYQQIVKEVSAEPNYDEVINFLKTLK